MNNSELLCTIFYVLSYSVKCYTYNSAEGRIRCISCMYTVTELQLIDVISNEINRLRL